jgi:hypothetical protein
MGRLALDHLTAPSEFALATDCIDQPTDAPQRFNPFTRFALLGLCGHRDSGANTMKITTLVENELARDHRDLETEFEPSLLIEHADQCILFDIGAAGAAIRNASHLGIDDPLRTLPRNGSGHSCPLVAPGRWPPCAGLTLDGRRLPRTPNEVHVELHQQRHHRVADRGIRRCHTRPRTNRDQSGSDRSIPQCCVVNMVDRHCIVKAPTPCRLARWGMPNLSASSLPSPNAIA